jgi:hypothetical protein
MSHARAADRLNEGFLDDSVLDIEAELARALLGGAPAHAVGKSVNVLDFLRLNPLSLLRDRGGTMVGRLGKRTHVFDFCRINHICHLMQKEFENMLVSQSLGTIL